MKGTKILIQAYKSRQRGAALVTVLFISLLLLTASAAMLTAVGSNSRNTTDVLSETKAYYAAETGIQAAVNVLRNAVPPAASPASTPYTYSSFIADSDLSTWLPYSGSPSKVLVGTDTGYSIDLTNPNTGSLTYLTNARWVSTGNGILANTGSRTTRLCIPNCETSPRTEISITTVATATTPVLPNTPVATFVVNMDPGITPLLADAKFRIDYRLVSPQSGIASIYGTVNQTNSGTLNISFQSRDYRLLGNTVMLCNQAAVCGITGLTVNANGDVPIYATASASFNPSPSKLKIISTGFGPNGAKKILETIVRRNFFDGFDPPAVMALIGPNHVDIPTPIDFHFEPGTGNPEYSGGECISRCIPPFAVTNQANLDFILEQTMGMNVHPSAAYLEELSLFPPWLQTPLALDTILSQLRVNAQHSGTWYDHPASNVTINPGNSNGTGITFCEGDCTVNDGGGLLVVTGRLTSLGSFSFNGMIIVTGQDGWYRNGGGGTINGIVQGSVIIAPYVPGPTSSSDFLPPYYHVNGAGSSTVPLADVNPFLDNTGAISDIVLGVAEK